MYEEMCVTAYAAHVVLYYILVGVKRTAAAVGDALRVFTGDISFVLH